MSFGPTTARSSARTTLRTLPTPVAMTAIRITLGHSTLAFARVLSGHLHHDPMRTAIRPRARFGSLVLILRAALRADLLALVAVILILVLVACTGGGQKGSVARQP